jgi:hypothetical protein
LAVIPLWAQEATVYEYRDTEFEWVWKLNPGHLTTGMEAELIIEARVLDGVEVNLSSELKDGDFKVQKVISLPLRWEKPFWVHEMRALLSTRLPGKYRLPQHTVYLQNNQQARVLTSDATEVRVHALFSKKNVEKKDLKALEMFQEKEAPSEKLVLSVLFVLACFCIWQLYRHSRPLLKLPESKVVHRKGLEAWIALLSNHKELSEQEVQELQGELEYYFKELENVTLQQDLKLRWANLRFAKHRDLKAWLTFVEECISLEQVNS